MVTGGTCAADKKRKNKASLKMSIHEPENDQRKLIQVRLRVLMDGHVAE